MTRRQIGMTWALAFVVAATVNGVTRELGAALWVGTAVLVVVAYGFIHKNDIDDNIERERQPKRLGPAPSDADGGE